MKCHAFENEARGVCKFCGRAIYQTHTSTAEYFSGYGRKNVYGPRWAVPDKSQTGIVVDNALQCAVCRVRYKMTF